MAQANRPKVLTASGLVANGECVLSGMYVNSTSSGTITLYNSASTSVDSGVNLGGTITPAVGYHSLGNLHATAGVYAVLANTINVTFHIKESD